MELLHAQTADAIMIKLIDQENLMEAFDDTGPPNLDMTHVGIFGKITTVPKGLTVKY